MTAAAKKKYQAEVDTMAASALRCLAFAQKTDLPAFAGYDGDLHHPVSLPLSPALQHSFVQYACCGPAPSKGWSFWPYILPPGLTQAAILDVGSIYLCSSTRECLAAIAMGCEEVSAQSAVVCCEQLPLQSGSGCDFMHMLNICGCDAGARTASRPCQL